MKKTVRILIIFVILCFVFAFVGCSQVKTTLAVPENVQVVDNVVHWNMVDGAVGYYLTINTVGHEVAKEKGTHFDLKNANIPSGTQCEISVRAVGDGYVNLSSGYSEPIFHLYIANETNDNNNSGNNNTGNNDNTNTGNNNNNNGGSNTGNNNTGNNTPDSGTNDDNNTDNNDNNQTVQPKPVTFKSAYYDLGIGRTVNALEDDYLTVTNVPKQIFTIEALETLSWDEDPATATSIYAKGSTMEEYYNERNREYGLGLSMNASVGVFTVGLDTHFSTSKSSKEKLITNELYYSFSQYGAKYRISIEERTSLDKVKNIINESVLIDLKNMTAEEFFYNYGTHVILAADVGGKVEGYYYMMNEENSFWEKTSSEISASIEAGVAGIISGKISGCTNLSDTFESKIDISEQHFTCKCVGGDNSFAMLTLEDFMNNYKNWSDSLNNRSMEDLVIIGAPKERNSLVAIWDLLPAGYEEEKQELMNYFNNKANSISSEFYEEYKKNYNVGDKVNFDGGFGSEKSPYLISTAAHLKNINNYLTDSTKYYALKNDINLTTEWIALGDENGTYKAFNGNFDGNGYKIIGLKKTTTPLYDSEKIARFGLFAKLDGATVKNIVFDNVGINFPNTNARNSSHMTVGALCGQANNSKIYNIGVSGSIYCGGTKTNSNIYLGGLCGELLGNVEIKYCYNKASIDVIHEKIFVGGIGGFVTGNGCTVSNCYNLGDIDSFSAKKIGENVNSAGGMIGRVKPGCCATVMYCYTNCKIKATRTAGVCVTYWWIGGMIGAADHSGHKNTVNNNYYCYSAELNNADDYNDKTCEIGEPSKAGNAVTESELKSGNKVGNLFIYSESDFASNSNYCWIYNSGSLPKLYWEK